ncbi:MAG: hypothetical protein JOZ02_21320, partial [Acidobacteria bacterium]|nr:hypothetical protein [Acidobacteriota bacterium]
VNRTYTLVGKNHSTEASANYIYGNFALQLLPSGAMRALLFDTANIRWQVDVPKAYSPAAGQWLVSADDDRWHLLSMVVNREQGRLSLYVDGIERGSAAMPAGFGSMISGYPLRAGTIDDSGPLSDGPRVTEFTGALDEIRLVRYARTAAEIHDTWFGVETAGGGGMSALAEKAFAAAAQKSAREGMTVESLTPSLVGRDSASGKPLVTPVTLTGRGLEGVQAQVLRDGKPAGVNAQVESSADGEARLSVSVEPSAPLGPAVLVLSKPGQPDRWVELRVAEQSEFAVEPDTLLLWHMDEPEAGAARLADAGPRSVEATAGASSVALPGRFGGARARAQAATGGDIRSLPFGRQSFTVEAWMKAGQTGRDYVLVGKGSNPGTADDWALKLLASGELRAQLFDTDGRQWAVERQADLPALSDERWHSVALVVDREAGRLTLYVDGAACATSEPPADFGEVRSLGHMLQAGHADAEAAGAAGAEEFPGALDELRISSTAHSPEKVAADFFGHDAPEITFARPANVPRGAERFAVTLFGYGLAGATVGALPEGVRAEVVSSTRTRVELLLSVPASAPPGPFQLGLSDPLARSASVEMSVSEAAGARGGRQKNAPATVAAAAPPEPAARSLHEDRPPRHPAPPEPPAPNSADYSRGGRGWRR